MTMIPEVITSSELRMQKTVEVLQRDLDTMRTGRAHPSLVEHLQVDYHGVSIPLNQIASITSPEARMLVIQPWDKQALSSIERGLLKSDLGLTPNNDGNIIRLSIPHLNEERRLELVRMLRKKTEDARIAVRNVRRDAMEKFRATEKNKGISQDENRRAAETIQKLTDSSIGQMDKLLAAKETEAMQV